MTAALTADGLVKQFDTVAAVNGVSLTINERLSNGVQISLIEYTLRHTALGDLRTGDGVNVEADLVGKFVQQLAAPHLPSTVHRPPSA